MRLLQLLFPLLACMSFGLAQSTELNSAIQQLPQCAQLCLLTSVISSPCQITDSACICADAKLQIDVEGCVLQSCTLRQALVTKNITTTICHAPIRYKGESVRLSNLVLATVTNLCALSRLIYKTLFSIGELGWDDYALLTALICGVPSVVIIDRGMIPNGLGRDVWTVPFDHITNFVRWLYALEILYFLQIAVLKLTLLFFFLRIFPKPLVRQLLRATIAFSIIWGITFIIAAIFQCQPISHYWTSWDRSPDNKGKCININGLAWSNAAISILLDIWMLAIPLYEIFHLQLSWRKKISVSIMICVGTFVTVVSILRLKSLVFFATSINPTWDQFNVIQWSNTEINVGIICACLPTMRVILVRAFPKVFGTTKGTSQPYYGSRSQNFKRGSSVLASGPGKSAKPSVADTKSITYTQTFEVQHIESDETSLVHMEDFGPKRHEGQSSSTSISSV